MDVDRAVVPEGGMVVLAEGCSEGSPDFNASDRSLYREAAGSDMLISIPRNQNSREPDPDDEVNTTLHTRSEPDPDDMLGDRHEPDPDDTIGHERSEPEPDPDDTVALPSIHLNVCDKGPQQSVVQSYSRISSTVTQTQESDTEYRTCKRTSQNEQLSSGPPATTETDQVPFPGGNSMGIDENDPETTWELRRMQEMTTATSLRLQAAIEKFMQQAGPSKAITTAKTLTKILRNVCEHPEDTKFRRLRKGNPTFMQLVGQYEGALDFLTAVGFKEAGESGVLVLKRDDPGLLWLARCSLDAACTA
eukprot:TRINITY_DN11883_c0_g1_i1.p1 TRINITY_DN11883_c0_g1~~TRINITY_DN11883_c0_g1_i1.p1  ORF type:complete len:346 (+),score=58.56 TRINITY_DN11883_c0_g1_i1:124-1038(+)